MFNCFLCVWVPVVISHDELCMHTVRVCVCVCRHVRLELPWKRVRCFKQPVGLTVILVLSSLQSGSLNLKYALSEEICRQAECLILVLCNLCVYFTNRRDFWYNMYNSVVLSLFIVSVLLLSLDVRMGHNREMCYWNTKGYSCHSRFAPEIIHHEYSLAVSFTLSYYSLFIFLRSSFSYLS